MQFKKVGHNLSAKFKQGDILLKENIEGRRNNALVGGEYQFKYVGFSSGGQKEVSVFQTLNNRNCQL